MGPRAALVSFFGKVHELDLRLDQKYLRSLPVNTEEGTPMGIGVWYEMRVSNPVAFLFENMDPAGSLQANVASATVAASAICPRTHADQPARNEPAGARRSRRGPRAGVSTGLDLHPKVHFRDLI
jgi:hypothetical protein